MSESAGKFPVILASGLGLVFLTMGAALFLFAFGHTDSSSASLPVITRVADFTLTNQDNTPVSLAALRGHVWVADIIFTRCAGPCPRMTRQMVELQDSLSSDEAVRLVTLTTDPEYDGPAILKTYAQKYGADSNRWTFLTGSKTQIAALATGSLKLSAVPVPPGERNSENDLWIHSTIFVVVDKHTQLRGVFETGGEGVHWKDSKRRILASVKALEREP
jgi:protein SCO1/2